MLRVQFRSLHEIPFVLVTHHAVTETKRGHRKLERHKQATLRIGFEELWDASLEHLRGLLVQELRQEVFENDPLEVLHHILFRGLKKLTRRDTAEVNGIDNLVMKLDKGKVSLRYREVLVVACVRNKRLADSLSAVPRAG